MNQKQAKELVRSRLSDKRYEHTLNVKKMAVKLAKRYGVDEDKAALAALLHDSAKEISKDEMRELMRQYPQYAEGGEERPNPVWHGICAAILARTQWGVEDEAILSAIACHTAGKAGMSKLDKVVYLAVGMVGRVEENLRPEEDAPSITEEIQTLEEYKGDVVNILVCGIDYEEGRNYSNDPTSNDGMTDMILYCQFDIKGGALRMLQIPRNSIVCTKSRKVTLSNGKTYAATNYQINSVALSNGGSVAALAEVIYDQYKLPVDYYVTVDMQALVEMVDNFGGIEVYIPHDMSFAGSALKQGYRNLNGASAEFFVRCRHGQGYSNSDIDRLNMQRYFYAGLFKRVRSMGITDVLNQLPLVFNNYIHTDMDLTTIAKMLVSFTRIDSANIMLAQTPVFMGVPNVGVTDTFDGYSCVVPDAGSIAELLNTYFRNYTGPVSASELNLVTNDWPHGTASTSANVQFVGQLDKESDDAILSGDTDVAGATTTDGQPAGQ